MSLEVVNVVDIGTIKKKVQKLNTSGNFVPDSIPKISSTIDPKLMTFDATAVGGHISSIQADSIHVAGMTDDTAGVFLWYFNASDMFFRSISLGYINITTLRSDVTNNLTGVPTDQTVNRLLATVYQNGNRPLFVTVTGTQTSSANVGGMVIITLAISSDNVTFVTVAEQSVVFSDINANGNTLSSTNSVTFVVPAGYYYRVVSGTLDSWYETVI